jgi:hypothetical protein
MERSVSSFAKKSSDRSEADFIEPLYLKHRQEEVIQSFLEGKITDAAISGERMTDEIVGHFLRGGFLQQALGLFPDPRKNWEVPMPVLLIPQLLQRLNNEHSLLMAPYCLNSAELITGLGYNAKTLENGFNQRNRKVRQTPFHGETLKHVLNAADSVAMIQWFNQTLLPHWQQEAVRTVKASGVKRRFIMDGMKIEVPSQLKRKYEGAGSVVDDDGFYSHGYKAVWLQQVLKPEQSRKPKKSPNRCGILVSLQLGPIEEHDLSMGRWVAKDFQFQPGDELIMDRGFIDGEWLNELHEKRGVEIFLPLRRNMKISKETALQCIQFRGEDWRPHPTRKNQWVQCLTPEDLKLWSECRVLKSGVIVKWKKDDGSFDEVVFVSTKPFLTAEELLATYDERSRIEETHRQLKLFQGIEKLPSKKWEHVVFRILMGVVAFNLLHLYLIHQNCETLEEAITLKVLRQKRDRKQERNPKMILYTDTAFAVLRNNEFITLILGIEDPAVRKRLKRIWNDG